MARLRIALGIAVVATLVGAGLGAAPAAADPGPLVSFTVESSAPVAVYGQAITFTTTLTGAAGAPTGTVDFLFDADSTLCSGVALQAGPEGQAAASCNIVPAGSFGVGVHAVYAVYFGDATYDVALADPIDQVIGKADSTLGLATSGSPSVWGQPVTFTATVAAVAPGAGVPAGTVAFRAGGAAIGGCAARPLVAGTATCSTAALGLGSHSITAEYGGSGNFDGSTGALAGGQVVGGAATTTTVSSDTPVAVAGQPVTVTATVQSSAGTPSGAVAFTIDGEPLPGCTARPLVAGSATCTHALAAGAYAVGAAYAGSADFAASTATPIVQAVEPAATVTALGASPQPSVVGQLVTLTATVAVVAPGAAPLAGTVEFRSGGSPIAGCGAVAVTGTSAVCATSSLARATHQLTARYSGTVDTAVSTSPAVEQVVARAPTAVALDVTVGPTDPGAPVTLTAQVTVLAPGVATPSGTVAFRTGATVLGTRTVAPTGVATLTTSALAAGLHDLRADYATSNDLAASTSAAVAHRVRYPTTVAVVSSASPSLPGRAVELRASVSSGAGAADAGSVSFRVDGVPLGDPVPVDDDGTATSLAVVPVEPGSDVTATYSGSALFAAGGPGRYRQQVAKGKTTTAVATSPSPSPFGAPVTVTAAVTSGAGAPDGTVTFRRGTAVLGTAPLDPSGTASVVVPGSVLGAVGEKSISAAYSGSGSFRPSTGIALHQVRAAGSAVALAASANPSRHRAAVAFTATVSAVAPGEGRPSGSVTFRRGQTVLGTVRLDGNGRARLVVPGTALGAPGTKSIQAAYGGAAGFAPATTAVLHHVAP